MIRNPLVLSALAAALGVAALPAPAAAQAVGAIERAQAKAVLIHPLTVIKKADMDFGYLMATGAGTAVLNPNANTLSTTGGVQAVGGDPTSAVFVGASRSWALVNIRLPNGPLTLTRDGGTETMTLTNWTLQGSSWRLLTPNVSFEFRVGGTLNVNANQADGSYTGTFDITVNYF